MSSFEDAIWVHLVDHHAADRVEFRLPATTPRRKVRPVAAAAGAAVLAVAVIVVVLVLSASTSTPPAYALTPVGGGSYTVSLNDISTGVPALNAKFAQLGIRETAVPIKAGCTASSFDPVQAAPGSMTQTVTVSNRQIPPGARGFIAAEQGPDGHVLLAQGSTAQPIPSCFPTTTSSGIPGP
jgi:outer membrane murein-binding lipoprotein Lpp